MSQNYTGVDTPLHVRSIVSDADGHIQHHDGAVRIYNQDTFARRTDTTIDKINRSTGYEKLRRLDHALEVSIWKSLIHLYLRNNETIAEYFGNIPSTDLV